MPAFILNYGTPEGARTYAALDEFTQGYIEAMFFTEVAPNAATGEIFDAQCESGKNEGSIPADASVADLSPEALDRIKADCERFQTTNAALLERAYGQQGKYEKEPYTATHAGHDYWYTRNGHGTGFWDRGLGDLGDALAKAARYSEVSLYRGDDGRIYV